MLSSLDSEVVSSSEVGVNVDVDVKVDVEGGGVMVEVEGGGIELVISEDVVVDDEVELLSC